MTTEASRTCNRRRVIRIFKRIFLREQDKRRQKYHREHQMALSRLQRAPCYCNALQCNVHCNAMQCSAMQCNAVQCNAMQYNAMQCNAMQCNATQCIAHFNALHCIALHCIAWGIALRCIALHCIALHGNAHLHCPLHRNAMQCNAMQ